VQWYTPVIPALGRLSQEDHELEASLVYRVRPCVNKTKQNKKQKKITFGDDFSNSLHLKAKQYFGLEFSY
jgi:hypothetical protein